MFVDRVNIEVRAGDGGDGCMSFRRERHVPRGGPDGGNGGDGGSIIVIAQSGVDSLVNISHRKLWKAQRGKHGQGSKRNGRQGEDVIIEVPPGTIVIDAKRDFVLKDLDAEGQQFIAARGGRGGRGNTRFKTSPNQAPRHVEPGQPGEHRHLLLELKVIADVGLLGKPNAGKSTLLSRLSRARPEIANYPFTTKSPNLGRVHLNLDRSFVMADIPGLIEGAHEGVGLGHEFLRHIERAGILVHLVEPEPMDGTDPLENYRSIRAELEQYAGALGKGELASRPEILCVSKAELSAAAETQARLADELGRSVMKISAVTGEGLDELTRRITQQIDDRDVLAEQAQDGHDGNGQSQDPGEPSL